MNNNTKKKKKKTTKKTKKKKKRQLMIIRRLVAMIATLALVQIVVLVGMLSMEEDDDTKWTAEDAWTKSTGISFASKTRTMMRMSKRRRRKEGRRFAKKLTFDGVDKNGDDVDDDEYIGYDLIKFSSFFVYLAGFLQVLLQQFGI